MVRVNKIVHEADSRIEAEAWIDSIGKSRFPGVSMKIVRNRNKWIVKTE